MFVRPLAFVQSIFDAVVRSLRNRSKIRRQRNRDDPIDDVKIDAVLSNGGTVCGGE